MRKDAKKILQISILSVFFLLIIIYAFFDSRNLIFGIKIKNVNIGGIPVQSGTKAKESIVTVTGNAKNAINLTLNGREISINEAGDFTETFALLAGYNTVNLTAKDKFGYIDEKNYKLIYQAEVSFTQAPGSLDPLP